MPYIDFSESTNGDGTELTPYNTLTELKAIDGDQAFAIWYIKRGGSTYDSLVIGTNCSNLIIRDYGTGSLPIIDASYEYAGTWVSQGSGDYSSDGSMNDGGRERAAMINNARLPQYDTQQEMRDNAPATWVNGGVTWINLGGSNPNSQPIRMTGEPNAFKHQQSPTSTGGIALQNLFFRGANGIGVLISSIKIGNVVDGCESEHNGGWGEVDGPGNCFTFNGTAATPGSSNSIRNSTGRFPYNNGFECAHQSALTCENNTFVDCSTGIELWGFITDSFFRYNYLERIAVNALSSKGGGQPFWLTKSSVQAPNTGSNDNNEIVYNVIVNSGSSNIDDDCDGNVYANNLHDGGNANSNSGGLLRVGAGTANVVSNNIFIVKEVGLGTQRFLNGAGPTTIFQYNDCWYEDDIVISNGFGWTYNGNTYNSIAALETANANCSANIKGDVITSYGVDPQWKGDPEYSIALGGPMAYTGTDLGLLNDYYGLNVSTPPSIGPSEVNNTVVNMGTAGSDYDGYWYPNVEPNYIPNNSRYYPANEGSGPTLHNKLDPSGDTDATIQNYTDNWGAE